MSDIAANHEAAVPAPAGSWLPAWARAGSRRHRGTLTLTVEAFVVGGVTLLCVAWVLQLWRANLTVPLRYGPVDDTKFYLMLVKGIIEHGWYLTNSTLGAPFGQQLYDYPQGADNLSLLLIRGLAVFSTNPAVVVNLFFLLTFALTGASAHLVLRRLGVSAPVAGVIAVLFSLLPYHFFRGESHLLLSAYYAVPLGVLLFLELLAGTALLRRRAPPAPRRLSRASRRLLARIGLCLVIGSDNLYYATFALVLIIAAALSAAALRRWRAARDGLLVVTLVIGTLAVNLAPSLVYRAEHGTDVAVERTAVADETTTEAFALRLTNLVLPVPDNRIAPLRNLAARYDNAIAPGYCEACYASLGAVGTVGFGWLVVCALGALAGGGAWFGSRRLFRHAGFGVAIALAVGTVGGLSSLFEFFITPDIRAWNRISVFIAFLSLLAVAQLLDAAVGRLRRRRAGGALAALLISGVLAFGVFEQTTAQFVPAYAATTAQWRSDSVFVGEIEARLPRGAGVFQLPYVPFPEGYPNTPVGGALATYATKYEPLRGYLHSTTLRWSYGALKGRPADWAAQLAGQPLSIIVPAAVSAGFDGVWVDPAGFDPGKADRVMTALRSLLRVAPLISPNRDLWFYDLRPYAARLRHRDGSAALRLLRPLVLHPLRWMCDTGGVILVNPSSAPRDATLSVHLVSGATVSRHLILEPGSATFRIPGEVAYATVTDDALERFVGDPHARRAGSARAAASTVVPGLTGPPCPR